MPSSTVFSGIDACSLTPVKDPLLAQITVIVVLKVVLCKNLAAKPFSFLESRFDKVPHL
jgi:hypothetical protein